MDAILEYLDADSPRAPRRAAVALLPWLESLRQGRLPALQAKGLALEVHADPLLPEQLLLDTDRLGRIVQTLLGNAIKFRMQGPIELRAQASTSPQGTPLLRTAVKDRGPGFDTASAQRLFAPFEMGYDSSTRAHGGLGLGLAPVQKLAQSLGGSCGVQSEPGAGSEFWVDLPLNAA